MSELLNAVGVKGWLDAGGAGPVVIQAVDLTPFAADLAKVSLKGSTLLGCGIDAALEQQAKAQGGHVVPDIGALKAPFTSFPTELYDIAFLYRGFDPQKKDSWIGTPDHIGWKFFMETDVKPNVLDMAQ